MGEDQILSLSLSTFMTRLAHAMASRPAALKSNSHACRSGYTWMPQNVAPAPALESRQTHVLPAARGRRRRLLGLGLGGRLEGRWSGSRGGLRGGDGWVLLLVAVAVALGAEVQRGEAAEEATVAGA